MGNRHADNRTNKHAMEGTSRLVDAAALSRLLREWREGDEAEQKQTGEYLMRALDENRSEENKLCP
jgi:hypothetical protein